MEQRIETPWHRDLAGTINLLLWFRDGSAINLFTSGFALGITTSLIAASLRRV